MALGGLVVRIATILFCEYVATTREGKLDAGGILQLVWASEYPMEITRLSLVAVFELQRSEYGQRHSVDVLLTGADGGEARPLLTQSFTAGGRFHRTGLDLRGLNLPTPGLYGFRVLVDEVEVGDATLVAHDREPEFPVHS